MYLHLQSLEYSLYFMLLKHLAEDYRAFPRYRGFQGRNPLQFYEGLSRDKTALKRRKETTTENAEKVVFSRNMSVQAAAKQG